MTERLDRIEANLEVLSDRVGQLAQEVSDLRQATSELRESISEQRESISEQRESISELSQEQRITANELRQELKTSLEGVNQARREDIQVMVNIVDTLSSSIRDLRETQLQMFHTTNADRAAWQSEIQRIWEYLLSTRPNGRGEQESSG